MNFGENDQRSVSFFKFSTFYHKNIYSFILLLRQIWEKINLFFPFVIVKKIWLLLLYSHVNLTHPWKSKKKGKNTQIIRKKNTRSLTNFQLVNVVPRRSSLFDIIMHIKPIKETRCPGNQLRNRVFVWKIL